MPTETAPIGVRQVLGFSGARLAMRRHLKTDRVDIKLRIAGVTSRVGDLTGNSTNQRDAA
jgi:hypothetical protein